MKLLKKLVFIFISTIILSQSFAAYAQESERLYGDVDNNGYIGARDALSIIYSLTGLSDFISGDELPYADTDKNGIITVSDAKEILSYLVGYGAGFNTDDIKTNGTMWIASDSIAAGTGDPSITGWGNIISQYLSSDAVVNNKAISGITSKDFLNTRNYEEIRDNIKPGDILIICFGHNDTKEGVAYTDPFSNSETEGAYKYYLKKYYIDMAYHAGAQPILMSSPARCYSNLSNEKTQYHYYYTVAAGELAGEYQDRGINLEFIDMFGLTLEHYRTIGSSKAKSLYFKDQIHFKEKGARFGAMMILTEIKKNGWDYAKYINQDTIFDPTTYFVSNQ